MRFTAKARLETWAHASRVQSDEVTYDLDRTVVGSVVAGVADKEDFVRVPYGALHEDVAAINDWHKMAAEALSERENKA